MFHLIRNYLEQANLRIYMLCFVDRGVLLGGGESVILWTKFFCCFANSQLLVDYRVRTEPSKPSNVLEFVFSVQVPSIVLEFNSMFSNVLETKCLENAVILAVYWRQELNKFAHPTTSGKKVVFRNHFLGHFLAELNKICCGSLLNSILKTHRRKFL